MGHGIWMSTRAQRLFSAKRNQVNCIGQQKEGEKYRKQEKHLQVLL